MVQKKNLSKKAVLTGAKTNTDFLYSRTLFLYRYRGQRNFIRSIQPYIEIFALNSIHFMSDV